MMLYLLVVAAVLVETPETVATTVGNLLPPGWDKICSQTTLAANDLNASFECHVTTKAPIKWQLADLRMFLSSFPAESVKVSIDVICEHGANISLPWPMSAPGLVELRIRNCTLVDKYADLGKSAVRLRDSLRVLDMRNSVWLNTEDISVSTLLDNMTSDYDCGQDSSIEKYIYSNISDVSPSVENLPLSPSVHMDEKVTSSSPDTSTRRAYPVTTVPDFGQDYKDLLQKVFDAASRCNYEKLEVLDESKNNGFPLHSFELMVFSKYPSLRILNYSYIGLRRVPQQLKEWPRYFPKLEQIDLSRNRISDVTFEFRYPNHVGMTLCLQYNNITKISMDILNNWARVPNLYVDIRHNPIDCNCDLGDFLVQLKNETAWEGPTMTYYRSYVPDLTCFKPQVLKGRRFGSLSPDDLTCPVPRADLRPALAALVVVAVVLLVMLVFVVRYRREVRILVFTRAHVLLPCGLPLANVDVGLAGGKTYDAFVAYAHEDSEWVLRELCHRLENTATPSRPACKLCIHQRDFVVGKTIIENIIDSIAASRHTIVVVSPSFVKSSWALQELRQALRQSQEDPWRNVIMVTLKEVEPSSMPPVLMRCCKTLTSLEASDALFWDRLQYSLHVTEKKRIKLNENDCDEGQVMKDDVITDGGYNDDKTIDGLLAKSLFLETMRTISVDSATSFSEEHQLMTPSDS